MNPVVIVKTGSKIDTLEYVAGDYEHWIARGMGLDEDDCMVVDVAAGEALPELEGIAGVVVTGSGSMVTEAEPWMVESAAWLREAVMAKLPVLGICFGHQLLAWALGGEVDYNPRGVEVGTVHIELTDRGVGDPLLSVLPTEFDAQLSHSQSVIHLPTGARLLASSEMEPNQAFTWGEHAWGIQFHPEFDSAVIPHFIEYYRETLDEEGRDVAALLESVHETSESTAVLKRFAAIVEELYEGT